MELSYPDYIIIAVLIGFFVKGLFKGLIRQIMALIGMLTGWFLAWKFYPFVAAIGVKIGIPQTVSMIIAFAAIYAVVIIVTHLLTKIMDKTVKFLFLGWANRIFGGLFGLAEGVLLVIIILVLISFTPIDKALENSYPHAPVMTFMKKLSAPFSKKFTKVKLPFDNFI